MPRKTAPLRYQPLLDWLQWNHSGREGIFRSQLVREVEIDTTTNCSGLPSCAKDCTYRHSRGAGHALRPNLAERILEELYDLGIRRAIFSGGGEPLEPANLSSFLQILELSNSKDFEVELLTNGRFLTADILPKLLPYLAVLRVSIPPFLNGYSHLQTILPHLKNAVQYRTRQELELQITASLLIRPDTPEQEIRGDIKNLSRLGIDLIRFKPTHIWDYKGHLYLDIPAYKNIIKFILGLNHPRVTISKINRLFEVGSLNYRYCYYSDFNPFVIGANGKNYACCEHKYHTPFQQGDFSSQSSKEILGAKMHPQRVLAGCFAGCKGDLANRFFYLLVQGYERLGVKIFLNEEYQQIAEKTLLALKRSNPNT